METTENTEIPYQKQMIKIILLLTDLRLPSEDPTYKSRYERILVI
jgi:hypothetical protein